MRKRTIVLSILALLVLGLLPQIAGAAVMSGEQFPVSIAPYGQVQPDIDYPWIVWKTETASNSSTTDIYAYNLSLIHI